MQDEKKYIYQQFNQVLQNNNEKVRNIDDISFINNDILSMQKHNELYTKILESYSSTLKDNIRTKRILKVLFFYSVVVL